MGRLRFKVDHKKLEIPKKVAKVYKNHGLPVTDKWLFFAAIVLSHVKQNGSSRLSTEALSILFSKKMSSYKKALEKEGILVKIKNYNREKRLCNTYEVGKNKWVKYKIPDKFKNGSVYHNFSQKLKIGLFVKEDKNIAKICNHKDFELISKRKKKNDYMDSIGKIKSKSHRFSKLDSGCRIHNVFTNCTKKYRKDMRFNGEKLVEIDVKSCYPLLLSTLYGNCKKTVSGKKLFLEKEPLSPLEQKEFDRYTAFVTNNLFYRELGISKKDFGVTLFSDMPEKAWIKKSMILYFRKHFPKLFFRLRSFRRKCGGQKLALFLQRWESYIMIDNGLKNMDFGAISVHDGVLVKESDVNRTMKIIGESFRKCLQLNEVAVRIGNKIKRIIS